MKKKLLLIAATLLVSTFAKATNYYSDPSTAGNMANLGTSSSPWSSLSAIFNANKIFVAGDTIFLRNGNHGVVNVKGTHVGYVVIMPQTGHNPIIASIQIGGNNTAKYWKFYKLLIQSEGTSFVNGSAPFLVRASNNAEYISISTCTITSNLNTNGWTRTNWRNKCKSGIQFDTSSNGHNTIEFNTVKNVKGGIFTASCNSLVRNNKVQYFTTDCYRLLASNITFEYNHGLDPVNSLLQSENHNDMLQMFVTPGTKGCDTIRNSIIRKNVFINFTDTANIPLGNRNRAQGIVGFNGPYEKVRIENNLVLVDHLHGISIQAATSCSIINNTCFDAWPYTPYDSTETGYQNLHWGDALITISKKPQYPHSKNNIVKNNITSKIVFDSLNTSGPHPWASSYGQAINNYTLVYGNNSYNQMFVNSPYQSYTSAFNFHLKSTSPAVNFCPIGGGAPLTDLDGVFRPQGTGIDAGCYEFSLPTEIEMIDKQNSQFYAYPNPVKDRVNIVANLSGNKGYKIIDIMGKILEVGEFTNDSHILSLENFNQGVYFIQISCLNEVRIIKIIKE